MLIIFDLDFTLWDAGGTWCDHTNPPYKAVNGFIRDGDGRMIMLYPEVRQVLDFLKLHSLPMAVASRTHSPHTAREFMEMFEIRNYFEFEEIYPGSKTIHFQALQEASGCAYGDMFFFDDEYRNIVDAKSMGLNAILVEEGIHRGYLSALELE